MQLTSSMISLVLLFSELFLVNRQVNQQLLTQNWRRPGQKSLQLNGPESEYRRQTSDRHWSSLSFTSTPTQEMRWLTLPVPLLAYIWTPTSWRTSSEAEPSFQPHSLRVPVSVCFALFSCISIQLKRNQKLMDQSHNCLSQETRLWFINKVSTFL